MSPDQRYIDPTWPYSARAEVAKLRERIELLTRYVGQVLPPEPVPGVKNQCLLELRQRVLDERAWR